MPTGDAVNVLLPNGTYADGTRLDSDSTAGTAVIHLDSGDVIHVDSGGVMRCTRRRRLAHDWLLEASDIAREELPAIETTPTVGPTPDFEEEMVSPPLPAFDESMPDWLFEAAEEMGIDTTIPVSPPPRARPRRRRRVRPRHRHHRHHNRNNSATRPLLPTSARCSRCRSTPPKGRAPAPRRSSAAARRPSTTTMVALRAASRGSTRR